MEDESKKTFSEFVELMKVLRGEGGCPWDREQTHQSIKTNLIEEAYEVLEAIEEENPEKLKEELGDLLLQVVFHATIAEESKTFTAGDVIEAIYQKMVRRHPHVFNGVDVENSKEVLSQWEKIKKSEAGKEGRKSLLDGVPKEMPALLRANRVQEKAARAGFDWEHADQVFKKVEEEMGEFREAFMKKNNEEMEDELGDLLFSLVNIARFIEVSPEDALKKTIQRFTQRFHFIERAVAGRHREVSDCTLEELETFWKEAKLEEREKKL
ncbi:MAG: nucleoside triphosphate pyrophosphohydrolase [Nitrospinota bacterium]